MNDVTKLTIPIPPDGDVIAIFSPALSAEEAKAIEQDAIEASSQTGQLSGIVRVLIAHSNRTGRQLSIEGGASSRRPAP